MTLFVVSVAVTWTVANVMKAIIAIIREKGINRKTIATNGGMPSGHTALVISLTTALFLETGLSPVFLTGLVLAILVMYDALKVRIEIERQARIINRLLEEKGMSERLEENVGHTPAEVLVSLALGIAIPVLIYGLH
jgi:acid phosphatase family membrane protein YuiD